MRIRIILPSFALSLCLLGLLFGVSPLHPAASSQVQDEVTAAQFAAALEAQKQADSKLTRSESAEKRFQELGGKLQRKEAVRVIVRLRVAFRPEGAMQQAAERLAQRASIRQAQDELLDGVHLRNPRSLKRFKYIPHLAFSVDAVGLEALRTSSQALDIFDDILIPPAQAQAPSVTLIGAPAAWQMGFTGQGKTIAILDSGVDKNHSSLSGKVVSEACYSTDIPEAQISSLCGEGVTESEEPGSGVNCTELGDCSHGTSVAGVAAGVAPGAKLISIKVASFVNNADECEGAGLTTPCLLTAPSDLDKALDRVYDLATTPGPLVNSVASVNISWAFPTFSGDCDDGNPVKEAIDLLRSVGVATVVAAGNAAGQVGQADAIGFPACASTAISVGATGDGVSLDANAVAPFSNSAELLSLLAPGYYTSAPVPGEGFSNVSGTSVAAAHVSGAWAILKQWQPAASVSAVLSKLANNGVNVTDPRNNITRTRIKVDGAMSCLQNAPMNNWKGEYFDNPDLDGNPVMIRDDGVGFLDMNFGEGSPSSDCGPGADNFSVRWTRTVPLTTNVYQFTVTADDGVRLYVDDVKKLDLWNGPAGTNTENVLIDGGDRKITLEFRDLGGAAQASLSWDTPCVTDVPATSWKGEYFKDTTSLTGIPLMVRNDGAGFLDFNWGAGGPDSACMIGEDNFSVRWTRSVNFSAGTWRFTVTGDDGVRLYVGGVMKIDEWRLQGPTTYTADMELGEGFHEIKLEYFESGGTAVANLSWAPAPPLPPSNLVASAVSPTQINLSWTDNSNFEHGFKIERSNGGGYSEIATVGANITTYPNSGLAPSTTYSYRVRAFNNIGNSGYSNESSVPTLPCSYVVSPDWAHFESGGGAGSFTVSAPAGCSWSAASNSPWITITSGASGNGNGVVNYWVDGFVVPDSFRIGTVVIAGWWIEIEQFGPTGGGGGCDFQICDVGYHWDMELCECVSNSGGGFSSLANASGGVNSATGAETRGLTARYFSNTTLGGQPALRGTNAVVNFNWADGSPSKLLPADGFSARWSGQLAAPSSETYTFYLYSDDGARLWVNNQLVIDRWQPPLEPHTRSGPVELKEGEKADVRVEYYNAGGKAAIHLLWSSASTPRQIIPQRYLHPEAATAGSTPADAKQQTGMLLPPGSDAGPKAAQLQANAIRWLASPLGRAGLVLLIVCGVAAFLLKSRWRQARKWLSMVPVCPGFVLRLRDYLFDDFQWSFTMLIRRAFNVLRPFISLFHNPSRAANLAPGAHRSRYAHYWGHVTNITPARRPICFIACFSLILSSQPVFPAGMGKSAEKPKVQLTQGPPGLNLPNLNEVRQMKAGAPRIAPPVSTPFASNIEPSTTAPPSMQGDNWAMELINPRNAVGTGAENLLSRNFNWGAPILSLPGRAGMDLNLGLSLNSLIWTKSGTNIHFNLGKGFPSPGFQLGFPEIGAAFANTETGTGSILVTMPSGQIYEFRANPTLGSNVYEEMGGTHMLLVIKPGTFNYRDTIWTLLLTDGTAYKFKIPNASSNNPKCIEIKDRNGNFISITYTNFERINAITDTLARPLNFIYDGSNRLTSITQNWSGGTHTYATFAYDNVTIQTNFPGLDMVGASNGTTISVLSRVDMADGKVYAFEYNSYAQVKTIKCYAPNSATPGNFPGDYTLLSSISYDLPADAGGPQSDCPRFFSRIDWAKDWNSGALTSFDGDGATWGSATLPDGTVYKEFFGASGWQRGLTMQTETWSNGSRKKWTTSTWANDDPNVSYWLNPRVVETNVYDENNNQKRTTIDYDDFGAVSDIYEYNAPPNTSTVLRHTEFEYLRGTAYTGNLNRRLTQLVTSQKVYDGNGALHSKVTYEYDLEDPQYLVHQTPLIRHDTVKFGPTFVQGRGNLNVVRRFDVTDPDDDDDKSVASTIGYNTSGSPIFSRDPLNHQTTISYTDSFSDSVNHNTLAYPTMVKDADTPPSTVQYNYDFGAVTRTQDPKGAAVVNTYDSIGRPLQATNQVNGAYTRFVYAPNHLSVQSFTTVNDLSSEFYQITVSDGHGRTLIVASDHPGSAGGYKAQNFKYDTMGRLIQQTNPTEINGAWEPAGDDAAGWVWSSQAYDWQGQPTITTNQDGTTRSISYEGCGCSGGDVVTFIDEGTLVDGTLQRRKQKTYHDVLGRVVKNEIYDWNNNVYTTTTQAYNVRDQVTTITRQQGSGGASQVTTFGYDGHGRLSTRQFPNASAPSTFVYNADDTPQMVTDARGASSSFSYNNQGLVTGITFGAPGGVTATSNVSFSYDEVGNRTSMTDGLGSATYHYDTLSRMDWETRVLTGVGSYTINYAYNLSGQLTSVTDPANDTVTYIYNKAGEIDAINSSNYGGVTQYAGGLQFRAWGGLKSLSYGNGLSLSNNYNTRLQLQQKEIKEGASSKMKTQYQYYPDGTPKFAQDLLVSRFDRAWAYDHVGRLSEAYSGQEADNFAGVNVPSPQTGPYRHTHQYDAWNNMTSRTGRYWSQNADLTTTYNSQNQRQGWTYNVAGNVLNDGTNQYIYDAAGRNVSVGGVTQAFDGLGRTSKRIDLENNVTYYLYSTPLGGNLLTELYGTSGGAAPVGVKTRGYVYAGDVVIAKQEKMGSDYSLSYVEWQHHDELTGSLAISNNWSPSYGRQRETDPMGTDVGLSEPPPDPGPPLPSEERLMLVAGFGDIAGGGCMVDGIETSCQAAMELFSMGAAALAPQERNRYNFAKKRFEYFRATAQGSGWSDFKGKWVVKGERSSSSFRTQIATENINDDEGNVFIHKGEEYVAGEYTTEEDLEFSETEYVNPAEDLLVGRWMAQRKKAQPGGGKAKKSGIEAVFDRSRSTLTVTDCDTGKTVTATGVFSGSGSCRNKSNCDAVKDQGPIPKGKYLIGRSYVPEKGRGRTGDWNWYRLYGNNGENGYSYPEVHVKDSNGRTVVRGGFNLHTGLGSIGCVTVPSETRPGFFGGGDYPRSAVYKRIRKLLNSSRGIRYNGDLYRGWMIVK